MNEKGKAVDQLATVTEIDDTSSVLYSAKVTNKPKSRSRAPTNYDPNWEKVRQEVTCAICLELLTDPKSMPCLHTYCKKCLMEALAKRPHDPDLSQDRVAINCPLCRAEVVLSDQGIEALPSNFSATRLVETVQLQDKLGQNRAPKCDGCQENVAVASCCECGGAFLCSICYKAHQNLPMTKNHHCMLLNEFAQSKNPTSISNKSPLCQKHPQELLKLYCHDCEVLVCRDCVLVTHRAHNYNFVDEIVEKEKKNLKNIALHEIEKTLANTSQAIVEVKQMQFEIETKNNERVAKLDQAFEEIAAIMQSRKEVLLQKIQQVTGEDLTTLKKQEEELTTLKKQLESCRDFTQDTLNNGTNSEIISARKQMLERSKHLQKLHKSLPLSPVKKPTTAEYYQLDRIKEDINNVGVTVDCQLSSVQSVEEIDKEVVATVIVKDTYNQLLSDAAGVINVQAVPKNSINASIKSVGDGIYMVSLNSRRCGEHSITISVAGEAVSCSSFKWKFIHGKHDWEITKGESYLSGSVEDLYSNGHSQAVDANSGELLTTKEDHERNVSFDSEDDAEEIPIPMTYYKRGGQFPHQHQYVDDYLEQFNVRPRNKKQGAKTKSKRK